MKQLFVCRLTVARNDASRNYIARNFYFLKSLMRFYFYLIFTLANNTTFNYVTIGQLLGATPYDGLNFQEVEKFVTKGGRLKKPGNVTPELFNVIAKCWAQSPQKRPTFKQLVEKLNDFKWMDCSYLPFASTNCTFVLQPAMDIYETKMEELLVSLKRHHCNRGTNNKFSLSYMCDLMKFVFYFSERKCPGSFY